MRVRALTKSYRGVTAVDELSLDVSAGTVFALLGPNGAGKTTTVECLEGFRVPDAGHVRVLGHDPRADRDALVARMGVMLQEGGAYQAATPAEMLRLHAAFHAAALPVDDLVERVGLTRVAGRRIRGLSGGERQRLNLALALVGRPDLLVLDEPTAGLDPHARRETWALLDAERRRGATILLTTHFMDEAERLADRVAIIDRGRLRACDSPAAIVRSLGAGTLEDAYLRLTEPGNA